MTLVRSFRPRWYSLSRYDTLALLRSAWAPLLFIIISPQAVCISLSPSPCSHSGCGAAGERDRATSLAGQAGRRTALPRLERNFLELPQTHNKPNQSCSAIRLPPREECAAVVMSARGGVRHWQDALLRSCQLTYRVGTRRRKEASVRHSCHGRHPCGRKKTYNLHDESH